MRGATLVAFTMLGISCGHSEALAGDAHMDMTFANSGHAVLARARVAAGGIAWDRVQNLEGSGRIRVSGLSGAWRRIDSVSDGRFVTRIDVGVFRSAEGSDGRSRWREEPSGGVHPLDGAFARSATKTEAWLAQRGWLIRNAEGAAVGPAATRDEGG